MNEHITPASVPPVSEKSREWLTALLTRSTDVAVIFFTPDGIVVDWLGAAERLFGYSKKEALGMPFSALFTDEDKALGLDEQELALARSSGHSEDDRWHVRKDAGRFWASGVLTALRAPGSNDPGDGDVIALCKLVRDRTDLKTRLRALENQLAARTADIERRNHIASSVAHELLNPMVPIMAAVALLQKTDDDATRARAREIIERQVGVLKGLVDDLNGSARALSAHALIAPERVNLNEALRQAADGLRSSAEGSGLLLRLVLPSKFIWINADPGRLQQMMLNLIANAIKYTPPGGHITLSAGIEGDKGVIRVEDDGRGIAPDMIPHIFELFTREERGAPVGGMGVGLAVVQDLARRHGGGAEARSAGIGLGSMFALRLPLIEPAWPQPDKTPAHALRSR